VRCLDATASSFVTKLRGEAFVHIHAAKCGIDCFTCQDEFFVDHPLDIKENDEHALDFAFHLSLLFSVPVILDFPRTVRAFSPNSYLIIVRVSMTQQ
jgi:hypothetical protein